MKHVFRKDENGNIDAWILDQDIHNGPECVNCDQVWCEHCSPQIYEEECPGPYIERRGQQTLFNTEPYIGE